ncbi:MAG: acetyl-CoA carboxylase biotin carboxyl carrier protein subunit [Bacteroidetes bacterium]|nr:MAG: acetyl-CoA carboxylase biotin carboxyl carrier protein subunit [Bacteroidota bacterium]
METEKKNKSLTIEGSKYLTHYTKKFKNRNQWVNPDERIIKAVLPGSIYKLSVKEGQKIKKGNTLFVYEAMKMRNHYIAPISGVIKKINVKEGQVFKKGEVLLEFE